MTMCQFSFCILATLARCHDTKTFLSYVPPSRILVGTFFSRWAGTRGRPGSVSGFVQMVLMEAVQGWVGWRDAGPAPGKRKTRARGGGDHFIWSRGGPDCAPQRWWPPICRRRSSKMALVMSVKPLRRRSLDTCCLSDFFNGTCHRGFLVRCPPHPRAGARPSRDHRRPPRPRLDHRDKPATS